MCCFREEEDFASKCGSLPKAFSSSNVNLDTNGDRKTLKRVSSVPQELESDGKPKIRRVNLLEDQFVLLMFF